jgi:isoleucyl-tRNA synthetase
MSLFEVASESYRKVRNTLRFLLGNTGDSTNTEIPDTSIDSWVLSELSKVTSKVTTACASYEFRTATQSLYDFCNDTLSSVYLASVKDRLYCDGLDSQRRQQTCATMHIISDTLIRLLAPFIPHTADEAWRSLHGEDAGSVHTQLYLTEAYETSDQWVLVMQTRDQCLKALEEAKQHGIENPLDAGLVFPESLSLFDPCDLADLCGVSQVTFGGDTIEVVDLRDEPKCDRSWKRDGTVKQRSDGGMLSDRDAKAVGVE